MFGTQSPNIGAVRVDSDDHKVVAIAIDASGNKWFGIYGGDVSKLHE
jgi:hypothetical protein